MLLVGLAVRARKSDKKADCDRGCRPRRVSPPPARRVFRVIVAEFHGPPQFSRTSWRRTCYELRPSLWPAVSFSLAQRRNPPDNRLHVRPWASDAVETAGCLAASKVMQDDNRPMVDVKACRWGETSLAEHPRAYPGIAPEGNPRRGPRRCDYRRPNTGVSELLPPGLPIIV